jgi:hypothetical protein
MMKPLILTLLLTCSVQAATWQADPEHGVKYTREQVELPADQGKWYLTTFGTSPEINCWFDNHDQLSRLKSQTHFATIQPTSAVYRARYQSTTPTPCIRLQAPDGTTVYQATGQQIPLSADALANGINKHIRRFCPDGNCPLPKPEDPPAQPLDHTGPPDAKPPDGPTIGILTALILAGLTAGAVAGITHKLRESQ